VLAQARPVVVMSAPYRTAADAERERTFAARLAEKFAGDTRVHYLNLGRTIDMHDVAVSRDGVTLTARGHDQMAEGLTDTVLGMLRN
jgi:hypothetical protein